jgi:hypothetical protein
MTPPRGCCYDRLDERSMPPNEKRSEDGAIKDDRYQSSNLTQTSNCRRQLLRKNESL